MFGPRLIKIYENDGSVEVTIKIQQFFFQYINL